MPVLLNWKVYICLVLLALGGFGGYKLNAYLNPVLPALTVTQTNTVEKIVNHTVTVTTHSDGTSTTTTSETTDNKTVAEKEVTPPAVNLPKWSVSSWAEITDWKTWPLAKPEWGVMEYRRLGDSNAWAGAGWDNASKGILIGVRIDF
jgi:hypothetical protein